MAGSGRFGKYGDLKRKEQIRSTRVSRAGSAVAKVSIAAAAAREDRSAKRRNKK